MQSASWWVAYREQRQRMKAESLISELVWMKNGVGCHLGSGKEKEGLICIM